MNVWTRTTQKLKDFTGISLLRYQLILCGIALAISAVFWLTRGSPNFLSTLIFTLMVGNFTNASLALTSPLFSRRPFPFDWMVYLLLLLPIGAIGSVFPTLLLLIMYGHRPGHLAEMIAGNIEIGTLFSLLTGISIYAVGSTRDRLEARNRQLQNEVQLGAVKLQAQEAELETAHEIQVHLLPTEIPQIARF